MFSLSLIMFKAVSGRRARAEDAVLCSPVRTVLNVSLHLQEPRVQLQLHSITLRKWLPVTENRWWGLVLGTYDPTFLVPHEVVTLGQPFSLHCAHVTTHLHQHERVNEGPERM